MNLLAPSFDVALDDAVVSKELLGRDTEETATETESIVSNVPEIHLPVLADDLVLSQADVLLTGQKILEAVKLIASVQDTSLLQRYHYEAITLASDIEQAVLDLVGPPDKDGGWKKQGESHGTRPTSIYYKVDDENVHLTCRIDTLIDSSLLIPLLSVLNESDLYASWIPSWRLPRFGVKKSTKLETTGRGNQTIHIVCDVPWPMSTRDLVLKGVAVDNIDNDGFIVVRIKSIKSGAVVPPPENHVERIDFEGTLLFRSCPTTHELFPSTSQPSQSMLLVSFKMFVDPHMSSIPTSVMNFVTRTAISHIWAMFLHVADEVSMGKRPRHKEAIDAHADLYMWVQDRVQCMLSQIHRESENQKFISYLQS